MKNLIIIIIVLFAIVHMPVVNAQNYNLATSAEFVFFNDEELIKLLENIICEKNACQDERKKINWYIDFDEKKSIVISQGRIANLMELNKASKRNIFATVINNNIVFVLIGKEKNLLLKTGFSIDLKNFIGKSTIAFEDFSAWLIISENKSYKLINSHIRKCD